MTARQERVRKYLSQASGLNRRIESKLCQIAELHSLAVKASASYTGMPGNPNKGQSRVENAIVKMIDMEDEINADMEKLLDLKEDIFHRIQDVDDADQKTLLELRYLSGKNWEEIAEVLGFGLQNVYRIHRKALDSIKIPES